MNTKTINIVLPTLWIIWCILLGYSYFGSPTPSCTYEYWSNGNTKKFEQACKDLKDVNSKIRNELESQQDELTKKNNEIRAIQDKVAEEINEIRRQDALAFQEAEE